MPFSHAQQVALAVVPKITGFASMFFSSLIVYYVLRNVKKRKQPYHRLLAAISLCDLSSSFWLALSTWPIPQSSGVLWAVGTDMTCNLQGFFTQFGISSSFYNASLSIYYLLVIKYGWKEHDISRLEPILHGIPLLWSIGTATAGLFIGIFGNASLWCWIQQTANIYRWTFFYGPLWCMILIVTVNCILIYRHVQKLQHAADKYRFNNRLAASSTTSAGGCAQRLDANRMRESSIEQQEQQQQQQQQEPQQAIILNSRQFEAIADSLIDEEEEDDDDGHHPEDNVVGEKDDDDDSSNNDDDDDDLEMDQNKTTTTATAVISVGSTVLPVAVAATTAPEPVATDNSNSRRNSTGGGMQHQQGRQCKSTRVWTLARQRRNRQTREVAKQSFLYAGAFYINWFALTLTRILQTANGKVYFPLLLIAAMTTPMQGLPNFLVYLRPRFQRKLQQRRRQQQQQQQKNQQQRQLTDNINNTATAAAAQSSSSR